MTDSGFEYTGRDNLEAMAEAVNYNRFLTSTVTTELTGPEDLVLDFGAGQGTYADMLAGVGVRPDVLEPDVEQQRILTEKGYQIVDLSQTGRYDVIYSLNVMEHIEDDQAAVDQLATLLRPGGRVVIYVPAFQLLFSAMDVKVAHHRRYRLAQVEALLRHAGLRVTRSTYCDPLGFFATLVFKWFGNDRGDISPTGLKLFDRAVFPLSRLLQPITGQLFGKNALVVAIKP